MNHAIETKKNAKPLHRPLFPISHDEPKGTKNYGVTFSNTGRIFPNKILDATSSKL